MYIYKCIYVYIYIYIMMILRIYIYINKMMILRKPNQYILVMSMRKMHPLAIIIFGNFGMKKPRTVPKFDRKTTGQPAVSTLTCLSIEHLHDDHTSCCLVLECAQGIRSIDQGSQKLLVNPTATMVGHGRSW